MYNETQAQILRRLGRNNKLIKQETLTWDGSDTYQNIEIEPSELNNVKIAVDNETYGPQAKALTVTFQELIRIDDTNATATIGTGTDGTVTVTSAVTGTIGDSYSINIVLPDTESANLDANFENGVITVTLGTDIDGLADATKNTATLIAEAIDALNDFSATASGDGSGTILTAGSSSFSGGTTERWADCYTSAGSELKFTATASKHYIYGPFEGFPKGLKGRLKLTASEAPANTHKTVVSIFEL